MFTVADLVQVWHGGSACLLLPVQFRCGMGVQRVYCCLFSSGVAWGFSVLTVACSVQFRCGMGVQRVYCCLFSSGVAWGFSVFTVACSVQVWHGGSAC